jgi:hypothetical protein
MRDSIVTANISERPPARIDLRKFTTPILVSLLRREMRFPSLFLIWCKLTVGRLEKRIDRKFPQELVDLAVLPLWVYINLKGKIGQKRAFEIMRIAILSGGVAQSSVRYRQGRVVLEYTFPWFEFERRARPSARMGDGAQLI